MYRLYEMADSGNCYKVRLLLNQLELTYERVETDIFSGQSRTYLAEGSDLLPVESYAHGLVLQWLFFEQYSHEPFIATNRAWIHLLGETDAHAAQIEANHPVRAWLNRVGEQPRHVPIDA